METITIAQAEKDDSTRLWVVNNSGGNKRQAGIVNITIPEGNGQVNTIRVPVTFIPVDLTTQATKTAILQNPQFRRLVQGRMILILSDKEADNQLNSEQAQAEQQRLFDIGYNENPILQETAPSNVRDMLNEQDGKVGGFALNIAHATEGEENLVSSMLSNRASLTQDELKYIVNNSTLAKVKAEAARMLVN